MSKEKCYIAGYIGDLPKKVYEANFKKASNEVIALGLIPICPLEIEHNHDKTWCSFMKSDLIEMLQCNYVYAMNNWRKSPGARIEIELALQVGLNIIHQPMITK